MQAGGVEFESPEGVEAGVCHKGQGKGDGYNNIIGIENPLEDFFIIPPHADDGQQKRENEEIEGGR